MKSVRETLTWIAVSQALPPLDRLLLLDAGERVFVGYLDPTGWHEEGCGYDYRPAPPRFWAAWPVGPREKAAEG
jgi:hypothetical protein